MEEQNGSEKANRGLDECYQEFGPVYSPAVLNIIEEINANAYGEPPKPKPVPRDFMKENIKMLMKMQIKNKEAKSKEQLPLRTPNRFHHIKPKVYETNLICQCCSQKSVEIDPETGIPTSSSYSKESSATEKLSPMRLILPPILKAGSAPYMTDKASNEQGAVRKTRCYSCSPHYRKKSSKPATPHPLGYIPPYIEEEKRKHRERMYLLQKEAEKADIPPGHVLLSEDDRLQTLELLKRNQEELMLAFQRLPIRCDTLRLRRYKEDLEKKLAKVEEGLVIFSKPKVFVRTDV